jgi:hypothetical protein
LQENFKIMGRADAWRGYGRMLSLTRYSKDVHGTPSERATSYIAPTWSWASLRKQAQYSTLPYIACPLDCDEPNFVGGKLIHAKVLETHIDPLGIYHTGAVRNGYLVLGAPLIKFSMDCESPILSAAYAAPHRKASGLSIPGAGNVGTWMMKFNLYFDYEFRVTKNDIIYGLLIGSAGGPRRPSGLIIRKSEVEDGSWERMGLFVVPGALQHGAEVDPMTCFNELEEMTVRLV